MEEKGFSSGNVKEYTILFAKSSLDGIASISIWLNFKLCPSGHDSTKIHLISPGKLKHFKLGYDFLDIEWVW